MFERTRPTAKRPISQDSDMNPLKQKSDGQKPNDPPRKKNEIRMRRKVTTKSLLMWILIRISKGGNKLKYFYTQKSVEFELPPHKDLNLFQKILIPQESR